MGGFGLFLQDFLKRIYEERFSHPSSINGIPKFTSFGACILFYGTLSRGPPPFGAQPCLVSYPHLQLRLVSYPTPFGAQPCLVPYPHSGLSLVSCPTGGLALSRVLTPFEAWFCLMSYPHSRLNLLVSTLPPPRVRF